MPQPGSSSRLSALDERQLIEAARSDPARFGALYESHVDRVYAYIFARVRNRAEAQDLTSQVFHDALRHLGRYEWRGIPFGAWLFRIAAHAVADHCIDRSRHQSLPSGNLKEPVEDPPAERRALLAQLLAELPESQRRVLELRFLEQHSIREIASAMGSSEGAVKQLQFRGLERLRELVGESHA